MARVLLRNVWKIYEGNVEAVRDLNLECADKEFLCLLGPSGCGKSSTMRMIAGLEEITSGQILIGGRVVNHVPPKDRDIAMVFENYALYPHLTVYNNIAMPLKARGFDKGDIDRRVQEVARILDIVDLLPHRIGRLSGGQKQRVGIGRAIVRNPAVFLMDEPISHLEAQLRAQMRAELKRLHKRLEATTIYVTHDQLEAVALADRIAVMNLGDLQQVGTPEELFDRPVNRFVASFLGSPPMNFVTGQLTTIGDALFFQTEGISLQLPAPARRQLSDKRTGNRFELGIRPQDVSIAKSPDEHHTISGETYVWEMQGETSQVVVQMGEYQINVETTGDFVSQSGERVWLGFDVNRIHIFDAETGSNLLV